MGKLPVPMPPPMEMFHRRKMAIRRQRRVRRIWLVTVGLWAALSQVFLLHRIPGMEMYPALQTGDLAVLWRTVKSVERGDILLLRMDDQMHIGRVAATEGDAVMMDDSGSLLVNGSVQNSYSLYPTYVRPYGEYPQRVPAESVFVLGDHRTQSQDSRDYGSVPLDAVVGKVVAVIRMEG